jgi:hypothetical protein
MLHGGCLLCQLLIPQTLAKITFSPTARRIQFFFSMPVRDNANQPGHVRERNMEDLRHYQEMLKATVKVVRAEMEKGKSLEEIKAAHALKDWEKWAIGPARCEDWIEAIYRSIKK